MTAVTDMRITETQLDGIAEQSGQIAIIASPDGKLSTGARKVNTLTKRAVARLIESDSFEKAETGSVTELAFPAGVQADRVFVVKLPKSPSCEDARKAGVSLARARKSGDMLVLLDAQKRAEDICLGYMLRDYAFQDHKSDAEEREGDLTVMHNDAAALMTAVEPLAAIAQGVFFTRDLVNEPANVLTTTEFAKRISDLSDLGVEVEILEEDRLAELGMGSLLCVGQGSDSPSKVAVMRWNGGQSGDAPLALVGKGVVFDTGGISLKPGAGMEDMTMDMGGAGVVAGVMKALALRKAKANVVGAVGLVENMPSGNATRPGDVVTSMKGDTIEVINTDAEGRLVLADVLWYTQETYKPKAMINLATLTGAIIVALGNENAGVFTNDDSFAKSVIKAAGAEGEGAWQLPLGKAYDKLIDSRIADIKNTGGRPAGSITAAQFLKRFVKDEVPWCHIDIAGVTLGAAETTYAPKGATGWGVMALNRLIADTCED